MSVPLKDLTHWLDQHLQVGLFRDYCPNGLQVEASEQVTHLVAGVTASQALIEAAIEHRAQAILVHHGYFWKGEPAPLTGPKGKRIRLLMQHGISLLAYHLPLDAHPQWGNNIALAELLGLHPTGPLYPDQQPAIGQIGQLAQPLTAAALSQHLQTQLNNPVLHCPGGPAQIQTVGWCTGAAQEGLAQAAALGCDAYISGEVSERSWHEAAELGIHYFAAGHHATERGGVQRLSAAIASHWGIQTTFVDLAIPV